MIAAACADDTERRPDADSDQTNESLERRLVTPQWTAVFEVGGTANDTLLLRPSRLAADTGGVSVYDFGAGRVLRFSPAGELRWSWGRKGSGPDEVRHVRDIAIDSAGRTFVLDNENVRLTVLDRDGRVELRIPLRLGHGMNHVVPQPGNQAIVLINDPDTPIVRISSSGAVLDRIPIPWSGYSELPALATQWSTGSDPATGRWVAGFAFGDGFFRFDGTHAPGGRDRYIEPTSFPRVVTERTTDGPRVQTTTRIEAPEFSATSITLSESRLYVLFSGNTEYNNRIIDSYRLDDGSYVESLLLPHTVSNIAYGDSVFYVLYEDPFPTFTALRPEGVDLP